MSKPNTVCMPGFSERQRLAAQTKENTTLRARVKELEAENKVLKESEAVLLSTTDRQETAGKRIEDLEATCAAQREALDEAREYLLCNIPANGWGLLDRGANADREVILDKIRTALSPAAGRDYRDAVLEEAAIHVANYCHTYGDTDEGLVLRDEIRSLKRGGK